MSTLSTLEANSLKGALEALLLVSSDRRVRIAARRAQG